MLASKRRKAMLLEDSYNFTWRELIGRNYSVEFGKCFNLPPWTLMHILISARFSLRRKSERNFPYNYNFLLESRATAPFFDIEAI